MSNVMDLLMKLEDKCRMNISAPAQRADIEGLKECFPEVTQSFLELYRITDGAEINVPGTVLNPIREVIDNYRNAGPSEKDCLRIGRMNFGDNLFYTKKGTILQRDHETGEDFLEWGSWCDFLKDELNATEGAW